MKQKNKIALFIMLLTAASMLLQSCGKDNLKYPSSTLKGRFTYQGQQVGLIWSNPDLVSAVATTPLLSLQQVSGAQSVYGVGNVELYAQHDGTFTGKYFNGSYVARTPTLKGPFEDIISMPITVNGDTDLGNVEVVPYFWMSGLTSTYISGVFTATFNLTKVSTATARTLQNVIIYISPTIRADVNSATFGANKSYTPGTNTGGVVVPVASPVVGVANTCTVKFDLTTLTPGQLQFLTAMGGSKTVWASVAVKTAGVTDALYSDPIQLTLP